MSNSGVEVTVSVTLVTTNIHTVRVTEWMSHKCNSRWVTLHYRDYGLPLRLHYSHRLTTDSDTDLSHTDWQWHWQTWNTVSLSVSDLVESESCTVTRCGLLILWVWMNRKWCHHIRSVTSSSLMYWSLESGVGSGATPTARKKRSDCARAQIRQTCD